MAEKVIQLSREGEEGPASPSGHSPLSWRSTLAGFFVSLLVYFALIGLGLGIGGMEAAGLIDGGVSGLSIGTAIWLVVCGLVSLFVGSAFAVRLSRSRSPQVGAAHGLVIAGIFFVFSMFQISPMVGVISGEVSELGWTLFFSILFGTAAAMGGGIMGARSNIRRPIEREDSREDRIGRAA